MKKQHMLVFDLDGTILHNYTKILDKTITTLKTLSKLDHKVVLATGRSYLSSRSFYEVLELDTPFVNFNGQLIHIPNDDSKFKPVVNFLPRELFKQFSKEIESFVTTSYVETRYHTYLLRNNEFVERSFQLKPEHTIVGNYEETLNEDFCGGIIFCKKSDSNHIFEIAQKYSSEFKLRSWGGEDFEVIELYSPFMNKALAIKQVADFFNISKDNIIAFGDGVNDLEMLEYANLGVSFEDASDAAKRVADKIIGPHSEQSAANFLIDYFSLDILK